MHMAYGLSVSSRRLLHAMESKVQKMTELNDLRERLSDKMFADNPNLTFFGVTMDKNDTPAIRIGFDPESDKDALKVPDELLHVNVVYEEVGRPTCELPRVEIISEP
mmetsp:Transcript_37519/g.69936  ORF Transcript_37519/g.69936 Transcript_37519/m.69936 type:complete len:107 (-) Transcript_37519:205-525(-)